MPEKRKAGEISTEQFLDLFAAYVSVKTANKFIAEKVKSEESAEEIDFKSSSSLKKQRKSSLFFQHTCPITHEIMKDPVIAGDGFTYERKAIEEHFNRNGVRSPMTRQEIGRTLITNRGIKNAIDHYHEQKKKDIYLYEIPENGCLQNRDVLFRGNIICYKDTKNPVTNDNIRITYPNGEIYNGCVKNGRKEGHGIYTFNNGDQYDGEWKNNKKEGHGLYTWASGSKYDGEFKNSLREGKGVYTYNNGDEYDGEWKNDKEEGHGVFKWVNGDEYDGEWKNGEKEGQGIVTFLNGDQYEGELKNGEKEGYGVFKWVNGDEYDGEWKNGLREGHGKFINCQGDKYEGKWINGNPRFNFI